MFRYGTGSTACLQGESRQGCQQYRPMNLDDTREKIHLQITQSQFKVKEARKKLNMAMKNIASADENLRCANLGFKEGVMEVTDVMAAQTAWQKAQSRRLMQKST